MMQGVFILLISCFTISVGLSTFIHQYPKRDSSFLPLETTLPSNCPPTLHFKVGYQRDIGGAVIQGELVKFMGFSYVVAEVCGEGSLLIDGEGQLGGDEKPRLSVGLNDELLETTEFDARKTIRLRIPHAGRLTLGYFNDYYLADVRVATLSQFHLDGVSCNTFSFDVPAATGGNYDAKSNVATLVNAVPMTIQPCSAGQISFVSIGRAGDHNFPQLKVEQGGKLLTQIQTSAIRQMTRLAVMEEPISIEVINPYGKQLADRNLILHSVKFIPASSAVTP